MYYTAYHAVCQAGILLVVSHLHNQIVTILTNYLMMS